MNSGVKLMGLGAISPKYRSKIANGFPFSFEIYSSSEINKED